MWYLVFQRYHKTFICLIQFPLSLYALSSVTWIYHTFHRSAPSQCLFTFYYNTKAFLTRHFAHRSETDALPHGIFEQKYSVGEFCDSRIYLSFSSLNLQPWPLLINSQRGKVSGLIVSHLPFVEKLLLLLCVSGEPEYHLFYFSYTGIGFNVNPQAFYLLGTALSKLSYLFLKMDYHGKTLHSGVLRQKWKSLQHMN